MDYTPLHDEVYTFEDTGDCEYVGGGLFKRHISPLENENNLVLARFRSRQSAAVWGFQIADSIEGSDAYFEYYPGASLVVCARGNKHLNWHTPKEAGIKQALTVFSKKSRLNLMRQLAKVRREVLPFFLTLTYPDTYYEFRDDPERWKRDLDTFFKRFEREYPGVSGCWRLELKDRLSGDYVGEWFPHFHLLIWGIREVNGDKLKHWISDAWYQVVGTGDKDHLKAGTRLDDFKHLQSARMVFAYVSKYLGKVAEGCGLVKAGVGRWWGWFNKSLVPFSDPVRLSLSEAESIKLLRLLRSRVNAGKRKKIKHRNKQVVFCNPDVWAARLQELLGVPRLKLVGPLGSMKLREV